MKIYSTPYFRLTFNEAHILMENIKGRSKTELLFHLETLYEAESDQILTDSTLSLIKKIASLSENEYANLVNDATQGKVLYPPNYMIE